MFRFPLFIVGIIVAQALPGRFRRAPSADYPCQFEHVTRGNIMALTFKNVEDKTTIDNSFSATDKATILAAMRTAYLGSPTAKAMFDAWISVPGNRITIDYEPGELAAIVLVYGDGRTKGTGVLKIDLREPLKTLVSFEAPRIATLF
jgi:hypothetical protein